MQVESSVGRVAAPKRNPLPAARPSSHRLTRAERLNVVFVLATSQLVQITAVAVVTAAIYLILGQILLSANPAVTVGGIAANGQLLQTSQNEALFNLLGTTYGGDGITTFALPDMRSITPNNMTYSICTTGIFPSAN